MSKGIHVSSWLIDLRKVPVMFEFNFSILLFTNYQKSKSFPVFQCHSIPSHMSHTITALQRAGHSRGRILFQKIYVHICMYSLIASGQDWVPIRKPSSRKPTTTFDSQEETARDAEDPGSVPGPAVDGSGSMAVDTPADKAVGREPVAYKHL